jgi:hypothetical protein
MTIFELGALGEFISSIVVVVSVIYLAVQVRQNTAQQKREETISIQQGQNQLVRQMIDPVLARAFARTAAGDGSASTADRSRAIVWVVQYLNHFQIVCDLHEQGTLDDERYELWAGWAVSMVAGPGIRDWWEHGNGKLGFAPPVRELIDRRLADTANPPAALGDLWRIFSAEAWRSDDSDLGD